LQRFRGDGKLDTGRADRDGAQQLDELPQRPTVADRVSTHRAEEDGYRILMDGFPGVIASDDDFGINSDGFDGDGGNDDHTV